MNKATTRRTPALKKRKILFLMPHMSGGGAERIFINLLRHLDRNRSDTDVFLRARTGVHLHRIPLWVRVIGPLAKPGRPLSLRSIASRVRQFARWHPRLLYATYLQRSWRTYASQYHVVCAFLQYSAKDMPRPDNALKIVWVHNDIVKQFNRDTLHKRFLRHFGDTDTIVCVSQGVLQGLIAAGIAPQNLQVVHNPTDTASIRAHSAPHTSTMDPQYVHIVAVGRLSRQKRYDRLIHVARLLLDNGILNFRIHVLGVGAMHDELAALAGRYQLDEVLIFHGWCDNPYAFIAQCDLVVNTSDFEGFSGVIAEARVLCKPIVTTRVAGCEELLEDGRLGIVVRKNSAQHLAQALTPLIKQPTKIKAMAQLLSDTEFPFTTDNMMPAIEKVLAIP